jgi:ABC-type oligopeptide transport system substrate-binding subunit
MSKRAWTILILVLLCLCILGAACVTVGYLGYKALSVPSAPGSTPTPGDERPEEPAGGVLRLSGDAPPTLDPAMVQDSTSATYVVHLFSGLISLNSKLEIIPDLATRWEVSEDGRTYTFFLRPEATFQDGKRITAADFVYSFERACNPKLNSPVAAAYLGDIVGVSEYVGGRAEHISGLSAPTEDTLKIEIDAPKAYFLAKLTYSTAFVVDKAQIQAQGDSWLSKPNGSGPFVLSSLDRERIVLVRNEHYYGKRPALERVEYILSGGLPITMYENDELDIVEVAPSDIDRVLDPENPLNAEHRLVSELSVQYLGLNVNVPPFDDLAVRQAFAQAIDKRKLADLVLKGTATTAKGILPPSMPDYDEALEGLPYDPERARQLLASSRYGAAGVMPKVVLAVSGTSGQMSSFSEAILDMIEKNLGIAMTVEEVEWGDFLQDLNEGRYQLFSSGWIADYPDSQNFLDILFHSASSQNHTGYHNEQVDQLVEQARVESDPLKRRELYRQAERIIVNDATWIPLTNAINQFLVKPYVKGFEASAAIYPWLKDVYLEK